LGANRQATVVCFRGYFWYFSSLAIILYSYNLCRLLLSRVCTLTVHSYTFEFSCALRFPYKTQHKRAYTHSVRGDSLDLSRWLPIMSTDDKTPAFAPLNHTNFGQWSIRMEAHLIQKELWGMVVCETDMEGKTDAEIEAIWDDWRKKRGPRRRLRTPTLR
jgi:hypothetical protein